MREINTNDVSMEQIREAIFSLERSDEVIIFRGGALRYSRDQWISILRDTCKLSHDRRHFDTSNKVNLEDWWEVSYQPDKATAYAYSKTRQPLHTDNAWFSKPAELNFFIMEKQASSGGEQTIYPLKRLIEDLSNEEPGLFNDLCNTVVVIKKGEHDYFNRTTIISLESEPRVFWNYYRTEKPTAEIQSMCDAFFQFLEKKESSSSVERQHCSSGDCFSFNDLKMLHGRTAFSATMPFERVLLHSMWNPPQSGNAPG